MSSHYIVIFTHVQMYMYNVHVYVHCISKHGTLCVSYALCTVHVRVQCTSIQ